MKKITVLMFAASTIMFSCNSSENKEVKEANENLQEAKTELKDAKANENEEAKQKETAEWKSFKNETDSSIASMENELNKIAKKIKTASKNNKEKLEEEYNKSKNNIEALKDRLNKRNIEFETEIKNFNNNIYENNQSFKREFKHDMEGLGKSIKDVFENNVK